MYNVGEVVVYKSPLGFAMEFGKILWIEGNEAGIAYLPLDIPFEARSGGDVYELKNLIKDRIGNLLYV